jgi:hypothetical protein
LREALAKETVSSFGAAWGLLSDDAQLLLKQHVCS